MYIHTHIYIRRKEVSGPLAVQRNLVIRLRKEIWQ